MPFRKKGHFLEREEMKRLFKNHSVIAPIYKHNKLPLLKTIEFDFYRCIEFSDTFYGKTVSELHSGNLRMGGSNRYASLFEGEPISYWADCPETAKKEIIKHGSSKNMIVFHAYDDSSSTFPTIVNSKNEPLKIINGMEFDFIKILDKLDENVSLSEEDVQLMEDILAEEPDCLAYQSHANANHTNFIFFERGFAKLSLRSVKLQLYENKSRNRNTVYCASSSDYSPHIENYGNYFSPVAKIGFSRRYLESEEYKKRNEGYMMYLKMMHDFHKSLED